MNRKVDKDALIANTPFWLTTLSNVPLKLTQQYTTKGVQTS